MNVPLTQVWTNHVTVSGPTYSYYFMDKMLKSVGEIRTIKLNYISDGIEALVQDIHKNQKYHITLKPV